MGKEREFGGGSGGGVKAVSPALKCSWNKKIPDVTTPAL